MRRWWLGVLASMFLGSMALAQTAPPADPVPAPASAPAAQVPVRAVVLFSSGVGYFEHFGTVTGTTTTELSFKTQQINDILKSLVLQDMDGGSVSTITYPSQDPIGKTLKSFQVDITDNPSLADLLNQLRGAAVTITQQGEKLQGTVLGVEHRQVATGNNSAPVDAAFLNMLTGATVRQIAIAGISSINLDDPTLQQELNKALAALAGARDQDKKPVVINFNGNGQRRVRIGYVVETPIWKTSYRLVLGTDAAEGSGAATRPVDATKAQLQGWAIVENQTDNDWNGVQLSLVSGRPISFVQDLYQPLYIPRPVVQPELYASLRPQTYEGGMNDAAPANAPVAMAAAQEMRAGAVGGGGRGGLGGPVFSSRMADSLGLQDGQMNRLEKSIDPTASISSIASANAVGELFQYTIRDPITLPRQRSAMIPIITDPVDVSRVSIYNPTVLPRNPLNGALLKNTTGKHLLAGPITVFDSGSYAGDARVDNVPPGQQRLLSYGIDLQMLVDSKTGQQTDSILTGRIVKGVLFVTHRYVTTQNYLADNKAATDKTLIIEHPLRPGWRLSDSPEPMEKTDALYRFKVAVVAGKTAGLTLHEQIEQASTVMILPEDAGLEPLLVYSQNGSIPKPVRDALAKAILLKQAVADTSRQINERSNEINTITTDQNRIRENMKTVAANSDYYNRLLTKLNDQESQLEKLRTTIDDLNHQRDQQRADLENYLKDLNIG
jgi:hypothetical protein